VCKLKKSFHVLNQEPRSWYSRLEKYLQHQGFKRGNAESNIYIKKENGNMIFIVVYVDDIIFGRNSDDLSQGFSKEMKK
jgi:hypothetical protein